MNRSLYSLTLCLLASTAAYGMDSYLERATAQLKNAVHVVSPQIRHAARATYTATCTYIKANPIKTALFIAAGAVVYLAYKVDRGLQKFLTARCNHCGHEIAVKDKHHVISARNGWICDECYICDKCYREELYGDIVDRTSTR